MNAGIWMWALTDSNRRPSACKAEETQNITIERLWDWYAIEKPEVELPPFR